MNYLSQHKCQCGCGLQVGTASKNDAERGWTKGQPLKFIKGHSMRTASRIKSQRSIGNKNISSHGYVTVCMGGGARKYEHIIVAENALGRQLKSFGTGNPNSEVVHHINGNKTDNRPSNLLICTHEYHVAMHHRLEASPTWPEFAAITRNGFGGSREH